MVARSPITFVIADNLDEPLHSRRGARGTARHRDPRLTCARRPIKSDHCHVCAWAAPARRIASTICVPPPNTPCWCSMLVLVRWPSSSLSLAPGHSHPMHARDTSRILPASHMYDKRLVILPASHMYDERLVILPASHMYDERLVILPASHMHAVAWLASVRVATSSGCRRSFRGRRDGRRAGHLGACRFR